MKIKVIVHALLINKANKLLVLKRSKLNKILPYFWDIPGGMLRGGEDPVKGVIREVYEETGIKISRPEIFHYYSNIDKKKNTHFITLIFLSNTNNEKIIINPREHEEYRWLEARKALGLKLVSYLPKCLTKLNVLLMNKNRAFLPCAVFVFLIKGNKALLIERMRTGFNDNTWSVPAGKLDPDESVVEGAMREVREEIGIIVKKRNLSTPLALNFRGEFGDRIFFFFICRTWSGTPKNNEPDRHGQVKWFALNKLPLGVNKHVDFALKKILKGETYAEYGF